MEYMTGMLLVTAEDPVEKVEGIVEGVKEPLLKEREGGGGGILLKNTEDVVAGSEGGKEYIEGIPLTGIEGAAGVLLKETVDPG